MSWSWRLEAADTADGAATPAEPVPTHANQADAETWLGEHWRELAEQGVTHVTLLDGDRVLYRMPLSED
jgi:hypothetical protein